MSYKRVVKKNGKVYGPYIYESYRDEFGNVKKRYLGKKEDLNKKKISFNLIVAVFSLLFLIVASYSTDFYFNDSKVFEKITGFAVSNVSDAESSQDIVSENSDLESNDVVEESVIEVENSGIVEESAGIIEGIDQDSDDSSGSSDSVIEEISDVEQQDGSVASIDISSDDSNESIEQNDTTEETVNATEFEEVENQTIGNETAENESIEQNDTVEIFENVTEVAESNLTEAISNVTEFVEVNVTEISTMQYKAVIGRPVKWVKIVNVSDVNSTLENLTIEIPGVAENVTVLTGDEIDEAIDELEDFDNLVKTVDRESLSRGFSITGNVVSDLKDSKGFFTRAWDWITSFSITGNVIEEVELEENGNIVEGGDLKFVDVANVLEGNVTNQVAVEYMTPAPEAYEVNLENGKRVVVQADSALNYTDVLAYVILDNEYLMGEEIRVLWFEGDDDKTVEELLASGREVQFESVEFEKMDLDNDGYVDYVEWVVPHFSAQVYEIVGPDNQSLSIWDSVEGNYSLVNENVTFFANYSNNSALIAGAACNISFDDGNWSLMTESVDSYNYTRNITTSGDYNWSVNCSASGYSALNVTDDLTVFDYEITACGTFSSVGSYVLANDITDSSSTICIEINANNASLDCRNHVVDGVDTGGTRGIRVYRTSEQDVNVTVENCITTDWEVGFFSSRSRYNKFLNNSASSNVNHGLYIWNSDYMNVEGFTVADSGQVGVFVYDSANVNLSSINSTGGDSSIVSIYSDYTNINNTNLIGAATSGVWIEDAHNNIVSNSYSEGAYYGALIYESDNSLVENFVSNESGLGFVFIGEGYYDGEIMNSTIRDSSAIGSYSGYAAYFFANITTSVENTTFVNVSFDGDDVLFEDGGDGSNNMEMTRKWYADVFVNDSLGYLENADVNITNSTGDVFIGTSDASGSIERQELTEFYASGTTFDPVYSDLYNFTVGATGYATNVTNYNLTESGNIEHYVTLEEESVSAGFFTFQINMTSDNTNFSFQTDNAVDMYIDWGEGAGPVSVSDGSVLRSHNYTSSGVYNISINGTATRVSFYEGTPTYLIDVLTPMSEGLTGITSGYRMFRSCANISVFTAEDFFDDVSENVTTIREMFYEATNFNSNITSWNTSKVTNMISIFYYAENFNQDLDKWDISGVTSLAQVFNYAFAFNGNITNWDTSRVTSMAYLFAHAHDFNQPIDDWDTSNVTSFSVMFYHAESFNQPLNSWNTSKVTDINYIFASAYDFNQDLDQWDTSKVTKGGSESFHSAYAFNGDVSTWNTSGFDDAWYMFANTNLTNQDFSGWDVSHIDNMRNMFSNVDGLDTDFSSWNVSNVTDAIGMFGGVNLSANYYSGMLDYWATLDLQNDTVFSAGSSQYYESSNVSRQYIIDTFNWTITDGGMIADPVINVSFVSPTPENDATIYVDYTEINATIETSNLENLNWSWNGTNMSLYDDSLVLMYNFDNVSAIGESGTSPADLSVYNSSPFLVNSPTWVSSGHSGGAYNFTDTTSTKVRVDDDTLFDLDEFTYSAWIYPTRTDGWNCIMDIDTGEAYLGIYEGNITTWGYCGSNYGLNGEVSLNEWHHVVWVVNASNRGNVYLDNVLMDYTTCYGTPLDGFTFGVGDRFAAGNSFNGLIDEVRVYSRAISVDEINALYNSNLNKYDTDKWLFTSSQTGLAEGDYSYSLYADVYGFSDSETRNLTVSLVPQISFVSPTPTDGETIYVDYTEINATIETSNLENITWDWNGTNASIYDDSLVLMYNFDNVSTLGENDTYVVDVSGNGNDGSVSGGASLISGAYGSAYDFDGVNDYVNLSDASVSVSNFTLAMWVNSNEISDQGFLFNMLDTDGWNGFGVAVDRPYNGCADGDLCVWIGESSSNGDFIDYTYDFPVGEWEQLTVTYSDIDDNVSFYINGEYVYSEISAYSLSMSGLVTKEIGTWSYNSAFYFNGSIDEVRLWNKTLSAEEIKQNYNSNLNKYDTSSWLFYSNQTDLVGGDYNYTIYASDGSNVVSDSRTLTYDSSTGFFTFQINMTGDNTNFSFQTDGTSGMFIDWGEGAGAVSVSDGDVLRTHNYTSSGVYNISINGTATRVAFGGTGTTPGYLIDVLTPMSDGLTGITSAQNMFYDCDNITSFTAQDFFDDVSENVTTVESMFESAENFNMNLTGWNTSKITNMYWMFAWATNFNGNVTNWDTSNVQYMGGLFISCEDFNQDVGNWNTSSAVNMNYLFYYTDFNYSLANWDTSNVETMQQMFLNNFVFNENITNWNTSKVTDMTEMFAYTNDFNQDISGWDTSKVTAMNGMFLNADAFNQDISGWDVSNVSNMNQMFYEAYSFDQDLGTWNVSNVTNMQTMFNDSALSTVNYSNILNGWASLDLKNDTIFDVGSTQYYESSNVSRQYIIDTFNWTITDGGMIADPTSNFFTFQINMTEDNTNFSFYTNTASGMFIDWGEGAGAESVSDGSVLRSHNYTTAGVYNISINGTATGIRFGYETGTTPEYLIDVLTPMSDGLTGVTSGAYMFYNCDNITSFTATDFFDDVSVNVTSLWDMFYSAGGFNMDLDGWNTSKVTNMGSVFSSAGSFNGNVSNWDTSSATYMSYMFRYASSFNQDLDQWDTSNVSSVSEMFSGANAFNGNVSTWNTSKITDFWYMFANSNLSNQDFSGWDVSHVYRMSNMFYSNDNLDTDFSSWNVSNASYMVSMFGGGVNLSANYYSDMLDYWATLDLQNDTVFSAGYSQYYESSNVSRQYIIDTYNWTITDGGMIPDPVGYITDCTNITEAGVYYLMNDITDATDYYCINITTDNVTFDGQSYTIDGVDGSNTYGISAVMSEANRNLTIQNVTVSDWGRGLYVEGYGYSSIEYINATSNVNYGLYVQYSDYSNLTNCNVDSSVSGIYNLNNVNGRLSNINITNATTGIQVQNTNTNTYENISIYNVTEYFNFGTAGNNDVFVNVNGEDKPIFYTYASNIEIRDWNNNFSQILIGGNNVNLTNITYSSSKYTSRTIHLLTGADGINIRNVTGENLSVRLYYNDNVTFDNITTDYLSISNSNNFIVNNSYMLGTSTRGMYFSGSDNSIVSNSIFESSGDECIYFWSNDNSTFYNNVFNCSADDIYFYGPNVNTTWNTSLQTGNKIFGTGSVIGGNYWTNPSGSGFSDNCIDSDHDGICDEAYDVVSQTSCTVGVDCVENETDYLALSGYDTVAPVITSLNVVEGLTTATVQIEFDEYANATVSYGETTSLGSSSSETDFSDSQSVLITGLSNSTLYYYNITACDLYDNCNMTGPYNFTTLASYNSLLIMHLDFEEGNGSLGAVFADDSGHGNNGTVTENDIEIVEGLTGNYALSISEAPLGYVNVPYDSSMDAFNATYSVWLTNNDTSDLYAYLRKQGEFHTRMNGYVWDISGEGGLNSFTSDWSWVSRQNEWHMHTITMDSTNLELKFYVDGVQLGSTQTMSQAKAISSYGFMIGRYSSSFQWNGLIDDVRVYNGTLSDAEIYQLYLDTMPQNISVNFVSPTPDNEEVISTNYAEINATILDVDDLANVTFNWNGTNTTIYDDSLVLMYNFDNVSSLGENDTYVVDMSGNGHDGEVVNATLTDSKFGSGYLFDSTGEMVNITNSGVLNYTQNYTWEFWSNKTSFSDWDTAIAYSTDTDEYLFIYVHSTGNSVWGPVSNGVAAGWSAAGENFIVIHSNDDIMAANENNHIVVTYTGSETNTNKFKIYVNGIDETNTSGVNIAGDPNTNINYNAISVGSNNVWPEEYFDGVIDEVRVYNRSLSEAEIEQHYKSNLNKYDTDKWLFYSNQTDLSAGNYSYSIYVDDSDGDSDFETRNLSVSSPISCGDTITSDTTLLFDMYCPTGNGLVIGANDVTLNCAGHSITGGNLSSTYGVNVNSGMDNVVVQNCNVDSFYSQINMPTSVMYNNTIENNVVISYLDNGNGIFADTSDNLTIADNTVYSYNGSRGIYTLHSMNNTVIRNNTVYAQSDFGVWTYEVDSYNNTIENNFVETNSSYVISSSSRYSIYANNTFRGNYSSAGSFGYGDNNNYTNNSFYQRYSGSNGVVDYRVENSTFANNTLNTTDDEIGLYISGAYYNNFENNYVYAVNSTVIYLGNSDYNTFTNNIVVSPIDYWGVSGLYANHADFNEFYNNNWSVVGEDAIWLANDNNNNYFEGEHCGENSYWGIILQNSTNNTVVNADLDSTSIDILIYENSTNNTFINCTYDKSSVSLSDVYDEAIFKKYFRVNVTSSSSPITGATILGYDTNNNLEFSGTTDSNGLTDNLVATEYFQNLTGAYYDYNNYTINASALGYADNSTEANVTTDYLISMDLSQGNVACGDTIVSSVTMDSDLYCPGETALEINADNLVLDCAGHTISSNGTDATYGIYTVGETNITIQNCNVSNFHRGMRVDSGSNDNIINNTVYTYITGVESSYALYFAVDDSNITNNYGYSNSSYGLNFNGNNNRIINNTGVGNYSYGILTNGLDNSHLENNTGVGYLDGSWQITNSDNNTLVGNNGTSVSGHAFGLDNSNNNVFRNNYGYSVDSAGFYFLSSDNISSYYDTAVSVNDDAFLLNGANYCNVIGLNSSGGSESIKFGNAHYNNITNATLTTGFVRAQGASGENMIINSSYNAASVLVEASSNLTFAKYFRVNVTSSGSPITGATILGYDTNDNLEFSGTTDSNGLTDNLIAIEYWQNDTAAYYNYNNYTINASASGYIDNSTEANVTSDYLVSMDLSQGNVACGDTIISSTTMDSDLYCPGETALTIGADDVVLDCNGHTISSNLTTSTYGILSSGRDNVVIKNCIVEDYYIAIASWTGGINDTIENNYIDSRLGINFDGYNSTIFNNTVVANASYGMYLAGYYNNISSNNVTSAFAGGIYMNMFLDSYFENNYAEVFALSSGDIDAFIAPDNSDRNTYVNNTGITYSDDSFADGFHMQAEDSIFINNTFIGNLGTGVRFYGANNNTVIGGNYTSNWAALSLDSSEVNFTNSIFSGTSYDIYGWGSNSQVWFVNATYNKSKFGGSSSNNLTFAKYFRVNVTSSGSPITGAMVLGYDTNDNLRFSDTTESDGLTNNLIAIEYFRNSTGSYYNYNNYTINASATGYIENSTTANVTTDYLVSMDLSFDSGLSTCSNLDQPDTTYTLTSNVNGTEFLTCMNVTANNITLDCNGYSIFGNDTSNSHGVYVGSTLDSANIKNCNLSDWWAGVGTYDSDSSSVESVNVSSSTYGIYVSYAASSYLTDVHAFGCDSGVYSDRASYMTINDSLLENNTIDFNKYTNNDAQCTDVFNNVNGTDNLPIVVFNSQSNISNWDNNFSSILFCNADNSIVSNITRDSSYNYGSAIIAERTSGTTFVGLNITGTYVGYDAGGDNMSVFNSTFRNQARAARVDYANNLTMDRVNIYNSSDYGIYSYRGNLTVSNSEMHGTGDCAYVRGGAADETAWFYNNLFNCTNDDIELYGDIYPDTFNTTEQTGTRVFGTGLTIGGNYWTNPTSTGFSDTCADADTDGICDLAYDVETRNSCTSGVNCSNNTDFLPLSDEYAAFVSTCMELDQEGVTYTLTSDVNGSEFLTCMNVTANNVTLDCNGFEIYGNGTSNSYGVYATEYLADNFTIQNCVVRDWTTGAYLPESDDSSILYSNFSSNYEGFYIDASDRMNVSNVISNDSYHGVRIESPNHDVTFENSIFEYNDMDFFLSWSVACDDGYVFNNVNGTGNLPIVYFNETVNLENWNNNFSQMILCGADNSNLTNLTRIESGNFGAGLLVYNSENITFRDSYFEGLNYGFYTTSSNQVIRNFNLSGLTFENVDYGLYLYGLYNSTVENSEFSNCDNGAYLRSYNVNVTGNSFEGTSSYGVYLRGESGQNVYNNFFNVTGNSISINSGVDSLNYFNTTNQTGTRVFGTGLAIGGNYYADHSGTGFSESCVDSDSDGFCDLAFNLTNYAACTPGVNCSVNATDYLPLSDEAKAFTFRIETTSSSENFSFYIADSVSMFVNWGDGNTEYVSDGSMLHNHTYATAGTYSVSLNGVASRIVFGEDTGATSDLLVDILTPMSDGISGINSSYQMFMGCDNITSFTATDFLDEVSSNITNMVYMFHGASNFNMDLSGWDTSNVTNMFYMFYDATAFNQDLSSWNTSSVTNMWRTFGNTDSFNGNVSTWDTSKVTTMRQMFDGATAFNQDLSSWDTSNVTNMNSMFQGAYNFNGNVSTWDVSKVSNMEDMFNGAAFNQNLGNWNVSSLTSAASMFSGTTLSTENYDSILTGWASLDSLQENVTFGVSPTQYTIAAASARNDTLIGTYNWNITDGGMADSNYFVFEIETTSSPENFSFYIGDAVNMFVNWGDGSSGTLTDGTGIYNHTYATAGTYSVSLNGSASRISFGGTGTTPNALVDILTPISNGVTGITTGYQMFYNCKNITNFTATDFFDEVSSNVYSMSQMFLYAENFNMDLDGWNTSNINSMYQTFYYAYDFNGNVSTWDTSKVTTMDRLFARATAFNQDVSGWNTSTVHSMYGMFAFLPNFDQDLSSWDTSNVTDMGSMFSQTYHFNSDISGWDVSKVTNMRYMFENDVDFEQDLGSWNVSSLTNAGDMFNGVTLSTENYDSLLTGWASLDTLQSNVNFSAGSSTRYTIAALSARNDTLIGTYNWNIIDGGMTDSNYFVFEIETTSSPENFSFQIDNAVDMFVNWGDGNTETLTDGSMLYNHTYETAGTYSVSLNGSATRISFGAWDGATADLLVDILTPISNGVIGINNAHDMFYNCKNITSFTAADFFDEVSSNVTDINYMFGNANNFNMDLNGWNTSKVTDMGGMFRSASVFNGNISNWDTSNVVSVAEMFNQAFDFNQDISGWNTSKFTGMYWMFTQASNFNQDISGWDVSSVTNMQNIFGGCSSFDQNLGAWDVSSVTDMKNMFNGVTLSTENYDSILTGWASLATLQNDVNFSGGNSQYTIAALSARNDTLIGIWNWNITDGGMLAYAIGECGVLNETGALYTLTGDVNGTEFLTCMNITAENVTLDCNGFEIYGNDTSNSRAIYTSYGTESDKGQTVKNCDITDWDRGIYVNMSDGFKILDSNFSSDTLGIVFYNSKYSNMSGLLLDGMSYGIVSSDYETGFHYINNVNFSNIWATHFNFNSQGNCWSEFDNVFAENGKEVVYFANGNYNISGWDNNFSSMVFCNTSNSYISNLFLENGATISPLGIMASENVSVNNVTFNGISGSSLFLRYSSGCNITNSTFNVSSSNSLDLSYSDNNIIDNVSSIDTDGILILNGQDNVVRNSRIIGSSDAGLTINAYNGEDAYNLVYNNFFNNTENFYYGGNRPTNVQYLNTTNQTGTRIYGEGTNIGGNYWASPTGAGYSEICADSDTDGFCDLAYNASDDTSCVPGVNCSPQTDFLPLAGNSVSEISDLRLISVDGENYTNSDLNCTATIIDSDDDDMNVTVRWYMNDSLELTQDFNNSYSSGSTVGFILNSSNITKHEYWRCEMRTYDGNSYSEWNSSNNLTIRNHLPEVTLTAPADMSSTTDRTPEFNWTVVDYDNDAVTFEINITPYYGSNPSILDERLVSGITELNYTPATELTLLYDNGYNYRWFVVGNDGEDDGSASSTWTVNISAEVGLLLLTDEIQFGSMVPGENNNTDNPGVSPIVMENNGSVMINVTINATALWNSPSAQDSDYQFKVEEVSGEEGSFNLLESIMSWFNMPISGQAIAVAELNYTDSNDSVELDINMTVPINEDAGDKTSIITLMAELAE